MVPTGHDWLARDVVIEVAGKQVVGGVAYFRMSTGQLLRHDAASRVVLGDEAAGQEALLFDFAKARLESGFGDYGSYNLLEPFVWQPFRHQQQRRRQSQPQAAHIGQ